MIRKSSFVLLPLILIAWQLVAQVPPQNWFLLDPKTDGVYGAGVEKAYSEAVKGKTSTTVIVAVIDGGVDVNHEDLKSKIWTNPNEVAGNHIDDDKNGYTDDIYGWDFIGGPTGDVQYDQLEITRLYKQLNDKFANITTPPTGNAEYDRYIKLKQAYEQKSGEAITNFTIYGNVLNKVISLYSAVGNDDPTNDQITAYEAPDSLAITKQIVLSMMKDGTSAAELKSELQEYVDALRSDAMYHYNLDYNSRTIVGDNYDDATQRYYGNSDVTGPDAMHGTHVAGIIGADRNNNLGIQGVADNVKIIAVRCVPDGDERDKDVANSIRYAVDMGAKVINMSFGKGYAYNKKAVDDAVKYASLHDVLLVHGSGNDAADVDKVTVYPNKYYESGGTADNFINVGATKWDNNVASFSNYGKKNVDVFAPGVKIYSTVPDNKYKYLQGTSMASPVVAGVAAMIRSYYPNLTAPQVRNIIIKSAVKMPKKVLVPVEDGQESKGKPRKAKLKKLCVSGGVVNAYNALMLAAKESAKSH